MPPPYAVSIVPESSELVERADEAERLRAIAVPAAKLGADHVRQLPGDAHLLRDAAPFGPRKTIGQPICPPDM